MKMKDKSYTQAHTNTHLLHTHTLIQPPPTTTTTTASSILRSASGGYLLRKAKKGLSVYFTLEIKLGFK